MPVVAQQEIGPFDTDFESGLLVEIVRALRGAPEGALIGVSTRRDIREPLAKWAQLTGNSVVDSAPTAGGWRCVLRHGSAPKEAERPIGSRLWLYTNFDCNLSCDYCCVRSSPKAARRALGLERVRQIASEALELGVGDLFLTGGEPFLLEDIGDIIAACTVAAPTTVLTNGMLFAGRRREALDSCSRERLVLQISLDSPAPGQHDAHRGDGTWSRAWQGAALAREMGFRVRLAATLTTDEQERTLTEFFDGEGIAAEDRVIRRMALRGLADEGVALARTDVAPEPTLTSAGVYWHPVGATDDDFFVTDAMFPLARTFETIRVMHESQRAYADALASVFLCA